VKIAVLLLLAREAQWPEALDWLAVAPLALSSSERREGLRWQPVWLSGCLEQIESLRRGAWRGAGG